MFKWILVSVGCGRSRERGPAPAHTRGTASTFEVVRLGMFGALGLLDGEAALMPRSVRRVQMDFSFFPARTWAGYAEHGQTLQRHSQLMQSRSPPWVYSGNVTMLGMRPVGR